MDLVSVRSMKEALSEVRRELQVREKCFDRWVADGKMTDVDAQDRFDRLASAYYFLNDHAATLPDTDTHPKGRPQAGDVPKPAKPS